MCISDFSLQEKQNFYMKLALEEADKAFSNGEIPVGAIIVKNDKIISRAYNTRESGKNAMGHAEINAINKACEKLESWRLDDCEIYVTLEPCPMCAGAIISSRIKKVIYGAFDDKQGCFGSVCDMSAMKFPAVPLVKSGVMKSECEKKIKSFFKNIRK